MKLARTLLIVGGVANALFVLFHVWLGWQIHHLSRLDPGIRSLLEMLNGGGTLFILFLAIASLAFAAEVLTTKLGRLVLVLSATLYGLRGLAEFIVAPRVSPLIVAVCAAASLIYVATIVALRRARSPISRSASAHREHGRGPDGELRQAEIASR